MVDVTSVTSSQDSVVELNSNIQGVVHKMVTESNSNTGPSSCRPQDGVVNVTSIHGAQDAVAEFASNAQEVGEKMVAEGDINHTVLRSWEEGPVLELLSVTILSTTPWILEFNAGA